MLPPPRFCKNPSATLPFATGKRQDGRDPGADHSAQIDAVWQGPCRSLPDGNRARTVADLHASTLTIRDHPCT